MDERIALSKVMDGADPSKSFNVSTALHAGAYETLVFAEGSWLDVDGERYATEEEARRGHVAMVVSVAAEMTDPIVMEGENA